MILEGRVSVNGNVVSHIMEYVDLYGDDIRLDGHKITLIQKKTHLLLHKPVGYVTTRSDPNGRPTIYDLLPVLDHWIFPVGRLDMDSEGLLLLTNDGSLADFLTDPASNVPKRYKVLIHRSMLENDRRALEHGVRIRHFTTKPCRIKHIGPDECGYWMSVTISEGKNRQVRQMMHAFGYRVHRLLRTHIGPLALNELPVGAWRSVSEKELQALAELRSAQPDHHSTED